MNNKVVDSWRQLTKLFSNTAKNATLAWLIWSISITGAALAGPTRSSSFIDYYKAGGRWLVQEPLYATSPRFLYSPLAASIYSVVARLPEGAAAFLTRFASGVVLGLALWVAGRVLLAFCGNELSASLLLILPLALPNLKAGQANILILSLGLTAVAAAKTMRWLACAACIGFMCYWKVYPIVLGLVLCLLFPKELTWRLVLVLLALFALSVVVGTPAYVLGQYRDWFAFLTKTHQSHFTHYTSKWRDAYLLVNVAGGHLKPQAWALVQGAGGGIIAAICWLGQRCAWARTRLLFVAYALATAWMLLFGPGTEAATYVLLSAPVVYLLICIYRRGSPGLLSLIAAIYLGLLGFDLFFSSLPRSDRLPLVAAAQPCIAMAFCGVLARWSLKCADEPLNELYPSDAP